MGDSLARIGAFPADARQDVGFQVDRVQRGEQPDDWKPKSDIDLARKRLKQVKKLYG